ncbi:MAG: hypothetical protein IIZ33_08865 [Erysipelotrichaceae bacterium]|nr:hypothetical protein [Erysipelotrichaceae bacterium]
MAYDQIQYSFLGRLLRRKRRSLNLKQEEIADCFTGFSLRSLQRMENGYVLKNKDKYSAISDFYQCPLVMDESLRIEVAEFEQELKTLFSISAGVKRFRRLEHRLVSFLNVYGNLIYFSHLTRIYLAVVHSHLYGTIEDLELIDLLEEEYRYLSGDTYLFALLLIYRASMLALTKMPTEYYDRKASSLLGNPVFSFDEIYYDIGQLKVHETENKYQALKNSPQMKKYFFRFHVLDGLAHSEMETKNYEKAYEHILQLINDPETEEKLPDPYLLHLHKRAGIISYVMDDYAKCYRHLIAVHLADHSVLGYNYLLLFSSMERLGKTDEMKKLIPSLKKNEFYYEQVQYIIDFYRLKYSDNPDLSEMEDLLCNQLPERKVPGKIYHPILREEIEELVQKTHHYQKLADFIRRS